MASNDTPSVPGIKAKKSRALKAKDVNLFIKNSMIGDKIWNRKQRKVSKVLKNHLINIRINLPIHVAKQYIGF